MTAQSLNLWEPPDMNRKLALPALYLLVILSLQVTTVLLFGLSQFGQNPFPELPAAELVFLGALFAGLLLPLSRAMTPPLRGASILSGIFLAFGSEALFSAVLTGIGADSVIRTWLSGVGWYLLAPVVAIGLSEAYRLWFRKRASLFAAMTAYVVCTLLANYTFDSFLPLGYGLVNVGTLFFGLTFTQRDRVHQFGRNYAYLMIFAAAAANLVTALSLGTPLRYVVVGFAAILLSETADTEVYQRFIQRRWLTRVATSNAVSIPIDTVVFTVFAFAGTDFATPAWMTRVILSDIVIKLIVGFVAALGIVGLRRCQQQLEALRTS